MNHRYHGRPLRHLPGPKFLRIAPRRAKGVDRLLLGMPQSPKTQMVQPPTVHTHLASVEKLQSPSVTHVFAPLQVEPLHLDQHDVQPLEPFLAQMGAAGPQSALVVHALTQVRAPQTPRVPPPPQLSLDGQLPH